MMASTTSPAAADSPACGTPTDICNVDLTTLRHRLHVCALSVSARELQPWKVALKNVMLKRSKVNPVTDDTRASASGTEGTSKPSSGRKLLLLDAANAQELREKFLEHASGVGNSSGQQEQLAFFQAMANRIGSTGSTVEGVQNTAADTSSTVSLLISDPICFFDEAEHQLLRNMTTQQSQGAKKAKKQEKQGHAAASTKEGNNKTTPESKLQEQVVSLHHVAFDVTYAQLSSDEALRMVLPTGTVIPSAFETVGHLAHLNLRDELWPYRRTIGQVVLEKNPSLRAVYTKVGSLKNEFRTFEMELLAGVDDTLCLVKEEGLVLKLDFQKVYWNSRLSQERKRLLERVLEKPTVEIKANHDEIKAAEEAKKSKNSTSPSSRKRPRDVSPENEAGDISNVTITTASTSGNSPLHSADVEDAAIIVDRAETTATTQSVDGGNNILVDMFAGIGAFSILAARAGLRVIANDLNPESVKWMRVNAASNLSTTTKQGTMNSHPFLSANVDARDFVRNLAREDVKACLAGASASSSASFSVAAETTTETETSRKCKMELQDVDGKDVSQSYGKPRHAQGVFLQQHSSGSGACSSAVHVVMNLPELAVDFLDVFVNLFAQEQRQLKTTSSDSHPQEQQHKQQQQQPLNLRPIIIHCHCFAVKTEGFEQGIRDRVCAVFEKAGARAEVARGCVDALTIREVRNVAPKKNMYCIEGALSKALLTKAD
ncbi:unnamed protein product [Amoebophrya sp. A25]|nr:unnamed protein product [Amoebophrya sp. A25]|eukprot:GSA25T00004614001.1